MTSLTPTPDPVSTAQIANLLAWARSLSKAGPAAEADQRGAYQSAKTALPPRLADQHPETSQPSTKDVL